MHARTMYTATLNSATRTCSMQHAPCAWLSLSAAGLPYIYIPGRSGLGRACMWPVAGHACTAHAQHCMRGRARSRYLAYAARSICAAIGRRPSYQKSRCPAELQLRPEAECGCGQPQPSHCQVSRALHAKLLPSTRTKLTQTRSFGFFGSLLPKLI